MINTGSPRPPLVCVRPPSWQSREATPFSELLAWVERAESLGLDGVFVGDRLLAEAAKGDDVVYGASMLDAVVVLSAIAARTERILLGPLVLVFPYRHPIQLAKAMASLDVVSGGRLVLGAGIGWNAVEFTALGIDRRHRGADFEESLPLIRELWQADTSHDGPRWSFDQIRLAPHPVRPGGPPVWIASFSPGQRMDWAADLPAGAARALDRVGRLADGWVPLIYSASAKRRLDPAVLGTAWQMVLDSAGRNGRRREDIDFVFSDWCYIVESEADVRACKAALSTFFSGTWDDALRTYSIGTPEQILNRISDHTAAIDHVDAYILTPLDNDRSQLDRLAASIAPALRAGVPTSSSP